MDRERPTFLPVAYHLIPTAWGWTAVVMGEGGICGFILPREHPEALESAVRAAWPRARRGTQSPLPLAGKVRAYFAGYAVNFDEAVDLSQYPPFYRYVLEETRSIPYGEVRTYAQLAGQLGRPRAARAVGGGLARNRIPLIIPCHRVIAAGGGPGGFSAPGGVTLKLRMLRLEGTRDLHADARTTTPQPE